MSVSELENARFSTVLGVSSRITLCTNSGPANKPHSFRQAKSMQVSTMAQGYSTCGYHTVALCGQCRAVNCSVSHGGHTFAASGAVVVVAAVLASVEVVEVVLVTVAVVVVTPVAVVVAAACVVAACWASAGVRHTIVSKLF